jgi:ubiquitin-protein ligase
VLVLRKSPPPGIQIVDGEENDIDIVNITLEGPGCLSQKSNRRLMAEHTPFEDGIFHLRLQFTPEYPTTPPTASFVTKIFHPNIAPRTGEVCVNTLKRDWNSKVTLSDILMVTPHLHFLLQSALI